MCRRGVGESREGGRFDHGAHGEHGEGEENAKCRKTVHFFLMEFEEGNISDHDWEVDDAAWFLIDEAIKKATYKGERKMLEKAKETLTGISPPGENHGQDS